VARAFETRGRHSAIMARWPTIGNPLRRLLHWKLTHYHRRRRPGWDHVRFFVGARRGPGARARETPRLPARLPRRHDPPLHPADHAELGLLEAFLARSHQHVRSLARS